MIFQTIDDKSECVGIYTDGKFHFDNFPTNLTKTWKFSGSITDPDVEYAWLVANGKTLEECAPEELMGDLEAAKRKMVAYQKSFHIAKIDLNQHCVFDLVPHDFLMSFCELKNKITEHVFDNFTKPKNYDHLVGVHKLLSKIEFQRLNLDFKDCKHLMYSSIGRQTISELVKNYSYIKYNLFGTVTGRLTTSQESFPILTLRKDFREIMKASNDFFISLDYNGAEVRTFLDLCEQEQPQEDIHLWNMENIFHEEEDIDVTRETAKTLFFSWLYNPDSDLIESGFYDRKKLLDKYYANGYINTPHGRTIEVDERRALNYLIQSTTSDRVLSKAVLIDKILEGTNSFISHIVHDELVIDFDDNDRHLFSEIKEIFEDGFLSNVSAGKNYGKMEKIDI